MLGDGRPVEDDSKYWAGWRPSAGGGGAGSVRTVGAWSPCRANRERERQDRAADARRAEQGFAKDFIFGRAGGLNS